MSGQESMQKIRSEIQRVIVGQTEAVDFLLTCLLANGHCLMTGVPGLAKTLLARSLAGTLGLKFQRIQFTPDLMPMDILGTEVLRSQGKDYELEWVQGPVFTHLLLADEINRATPRTQSALLQTMQEREIHVLGRHFILEQPFMVIATRNPLDQEGTFPLPEAQLDRFLMNVEMNYPSEDEEFKMLKMKGESTSAIIKEVMSREELLEHQKAVYKVAVSEDLLRRIVRLVQRSRPVTNEKIRDRIVWGAGPRATEFLLHASRAYAYLHGNLALDWEHVEKIAFPVLNHRIEMRMSLGLSAGDEKRSFVQDMLA